MPEFVFTDEFDDIEVLIATSAGSMMVTVIEGDRSYSEGGQILTIREFVELVRERKGM